MKNKMSNWSIVGIGIGFIFTIFSGIRYFLMYPDMDKAIVYVIIGVLIMCVSWNYNVNISQDNRLVAVEDYLVDKNFEDKTPEEPEETT